MTSLLPGDLPGDSGVFTENTNAASAFVFLGTEPFIKEHVEKDQFKAVDKIFYGDRKYPEAGIFVIIIPYHGFFEA